MIDPREIEHAAKLKVSCTIIAKNEADRIGRCLDSVRDVVDEIVVVDSGSIDATVEIGAQKGATCYFNPWIGYGQQKRYAEDRCRHDWVLNLDADEWLTEAGRAELIGILARPIPPHIFGFRFTIKQVYPGKDEPRFLADFHKYVRLYNKKQCRFPESAVFDEVKIPEANRINIKSPIYHQSVRSLSHLVEKNLQYYRMQREEIDKNIPLSALRMLFEPMLIFFKYYIMRRHITGGIYGFALSATISGLRTYRLAILIARSSSRKFGKPS